MVCAACGYTVPKRMQATHNLTFVGFMATPWSHGEPVAVWLCPLCYQEYERGSLALDVVR